MSVYLGEKLYAGTFASGGGGTGSGGITVTNLYTGSLSDGNSATLSDSYKNYNFLVAIAGISGSAQYQYSGFFSVADIPQSGTRQLYLATPFELNTNGTMKNYCGMVVGIKDDTTIDVTSKHTGWQSGTLFRLIGIKISE